MQKPLNSQSKYLYTTPKVIPTPQANISCAHACLLPETSFNMLALLDYVSNCLVSRLQAQETLRGFLTGLCTNICVAV